MTTQETPAATLDAIGLKCPLPVLKARRAIAELDAGEILEVLASDPAAVEDFTAFCGVTGHLLLGHSTDGDVQRFLIRKKAEGG